MIKKSKSALLGRAMIRVGTMGMVLVTTASVALAENVYAQNAATWVLDGAFWLIIVLGVIGIGMAAVKRNASLALGILVGAGIAAYFCKNPNALATIGSNIARIFGL